MKKVEFFVGKYKLSGTIILPKKLKAKNPAILFIQGWTGEKERSYQYANGLAKLGYVSFLFDNLGHGESEGNINTTTTKEFLDGVLSAYDYLINIDGVDSENISVVGSSFGGYLAALITTKRKVKRLVLRVPADYPNEAFNKPKMQASGSDNPEIIAWRAKARRPEETFALAGIHKFGGKILVIESEKDDIIPHQAVQNYLNATRDMRKLTHIVVKGAPHSTREGAFRDKIEQILVAWFGNRS